MRCEGKENVTLTFSGRKENLDDTSAVSIVVHGCDPRNETKYPFSVTFLHSHRDIQTNSNFFIHCTRVKDNTILHTWSYTPSQYSELQLK